MNKVYPGVNWILRLYLYSSILLAFIDFYSTFEISVQWLKSYAYYGILIAPILQIAWSLTLRRNWSLVNLDLLIPLAFSVFVLTLNPSKILWYISTWDTQTIQYQKIDDPKVRVEFQMRDLGARGYGRRTVKVEYYTPLFMEVTRVPLNIDSSPEWKRVDIDVNEIGLKGG